MFGFRSTKRAVIASATLAVSALALTAIPAQAFNVHAVNGITSSTIKLGITIPLTGSAAPGYNKIPAAMTAYFNYVNENGGVFGRKITLVVKDDQYLPQAAILQTNNLILKDKVFAVVGALGTANNRAVASSVNLGRRGIPSLFVNTGYSGFADPMKYPTSFSLFPSYIMEAKIMSQYLAENFAGKKIGLIYQDDDFGTDALVGFKQAGLKFDIALPYASGSQSAQNAAIWVGKLKAAGAEVVVMFGVTTASGAALATAAALGYKPQWILGSVGGDATTLKAVGVPSAVLTGAIGASFLPAPTDTTDPYVSFFQGINTKYNMGAVFDNNVLVGMNTAMMTVQALRAAGTSPTRNKLIAALESKGSTFASAGLSPILYAKGVHVGYSGYWFGSYNSSGELKPVGGNYSIYTTDSGAGPIVKSNYKRPAFPANGLPTN
jgi:branched-chain amino acid transport system substrate-binding protein